MKNKPQKVTLTEERIKKIKEKYKYTSLDVFSPSFLSEYKDQIATYFQTPEQQEYLRANMDRITEFCIADRLSNGLSPLCNGSEYIQMDSSFVDLTDDSFSIKPGSEYVETMLVHQLLHAATRQKGNNRNLTGVVEFIRDEAGKAVRGPNNKKNVALNEGLTRYFAEKISGKPIPNEVDNYAYNKSIVYLLSSVLGEDVLKSSYFGNGTNLKDVLNALAQDETFYDDFNKRLDTISKMETTIRRIRSGQIKTADAESIARMEAVNEAQKTALMENLFAKVIIPQVQKIEVPEIVDYSNHSQVEAHNLALQQRQAILLPILKEHPDLLKSVAKYIPEHSFSNFVTNEVLKEIQQEILSNGMSFDKIAQVARKVNENLTIGPRITKDFLGTVDDFYNNNPTAMQDRSTTMTPLLRRQLESMVNVLDQLEEAARLNPTAEMEESVRNYREGFLRKHFQKIPNLDQEIERIREEKRKKQQKDGNEGPELAPDVAAILEEARKKGEDQAKSDVGDTSKQEISEEQREVNTTRKFSINDRFIIDNQTGAVIDQRNLPMNKKVENIARATGEFDVTKDPVLVDMTTKSSKAYVQGLIPTLKPEKIQILKKHYGDNWEQVIQQAFEQGYNQGLNIAFAQAKEKGLVDRREITEAIKSGTLPEESKIAIDLEEVQYVAANFDVKKTETGETIVVDKVTEQPVLSSKTVHSLAFASEWVNATGDRAFAPGQERVYRFVQVEATKSLETEGAIDPVEIVADADAMGEEYKVVVEKLFAGNQPPTAVENFFAQQTPKAVKKEETYVVETPPVIDVSVSEEMSPPAKHPVESFHDVMGHLDTASLEEVKGQLEIFNGASIEIDGTRHHPYNDPVSAAKFNARYFDLTGEYHPRFMEQAPIVIEGLMRDKEELIKTGAYKPEYFERLETISSDISSRQIDTPEMENAPKAR